MKGFFFLCLLTQKIKILHNCCIQSYAEHPSQLLVHVVLETVVSHVAWDVTLPKQYSCSSSRLPSTITATWQDECSCEHHGGHGKETPSPGSFKTQTLSFTIYFAFVKL